MPLNCYLTLSFSPSNYFSINYYCFSEFIFAEFNLFVESNSFSTRLYFLDLHSPFKSWKWITNFMIYRFCPQIFFLLLHLYNNPCPFTIILFSFFKDYYYINQSPHYAILTFIKKKIATYSLITNLVNL